MGMTIDEVIKALKWFLEYNEEDYYVDDYYDGDRFQDKYGDWFYKVSERDFKAFRQAVDIMRKYQKIEHILKAEIPYKLVEIEKVVKDGME